MKHPLIGLVVLVALLGGAVGLFGMGNWSFHGMMGMSGGMGRMGGSPAPAPVNAPAAVSRYGCMSCHAVDHASVGPAFQWVAWRFAGKPHAQEDIAAFIQHGGKGPWGGVMPDLNVTVTDAAALSKWILALPPQTPPGRSSR